MNHSSLRVGKAGSRAVARAMGEIRRGVPVILLHGDDRLLALAAETATPATLQEFLAVTADGADPVLLLAPTRAAALALTAAVGQAGAVAIGLSRTRLDTVMLHALADPTAPAAPDATLVDTPQAMVPPPATQAALLLAKLARLLPAMLVAPAAAEAGAHGTLLEVEAADILVEPGLANDGLVRAAEARVPLAEAGDARIVAFRPPDGGLEHLAVLIGHPERVAPSAQPPLVRIHSECFTGDILGSLRCDCGPQLHQAIRRMEAEGAGILLYMAQEGRGIGLVNKLRAYALQDGLDGAPGLDTLDANRALGYGADERSFAGAAAMLRHLGVTRIRLLTNNPDKIAGLVAHGIEVAGRLRHAIAANGTNDLYLETKARRFGHLLG